MPDASRRQSALRNHCPPLRNMAPQHRAEHGANPPTTAAVNVMRFSSGGNEAERELAVTCTSTTPAIDAGSPRSRTR